MTIGYFIAFAGIKFFSQFSFMQLPVNGWTMILAIAIADFLYYNVTEIWNSIFGSPEWKPEKLN